MKTYKIKLNSKIDPQYLVDNFNDTHNHVFISIYEGKVLYQGRLIQEWKIIIDENEMTIDTAEEVAEELNEAIAFIKRNENQ